MPLPAPSKTPRVVVWLVSMATTEGWTAERMAWMSRAPVSVVRGTDGRSTDATGSPSLSAKVTSDATSAATIAPTRAPSRAARPGRIPGRGSGSDGSEVRQAGGDGLTAGPSKVGQLGGAGASVVVGGSMAEGREAGAGPHCWVGGSSGGVGCRGGGGGGGGGAPGATRGGPLGSLGFIPQ
jgi:hypothetical protein